MDLVLAAALIGGAVAFFAVIIGLNVWFGGMPSKGVDLDALVSPGHTFDPSTSFRARGGVVQGMFRVTGPLCTLTMDADWAHVSGTVDVWIARNRVVSVNRTPAELRHLLPQGIRFASETGAYDDLLFCGDGLGVLSAASALGWPTADLVEPRP